MRIGISAFAGDGGKSGISQYMINIFRRLPDMGPDDEFVMFMAASDCEFLDPQHSRVHVVSFPDWLAKPGINILWHLFLLPWYLWRHGCELVFMPAGNRRLAWWYGVPSIGTVHDLSQLHVPAKYDRLRMFYVVRMLPRLMRRLDHVISVSKATRRDLVSFAGVDPQRISVIHNGADLRRFSPQNRAKASQQLRQEFGLTGPYILYIARLEHPGKNHVALIEAFARLKRERQIPHRLVLPGGEWNGAETIYQAAHESGVEDQIDFLGFVPNDILPALYAGADLFVFPSLFEGFGIPLLEAMASGTPVCAADVSSIPEVVGDAGLLFDPTDSSQIGDCIAHLLDDKALYAELAMRGLQQATHFSWDNATRDIVALCHENRG
jgi:glycosyltransferase involved in cell wall biosynthesis